MSIINRLLQAAFVVIAITFAGFSMFQYAGDPVLNMTGPETTQSERDELRTQLGLDQPMPTQFARYMTRVLKGDFGISYAYRRPVLDLLRERLPATLEIVVLAAFVAVFLAIPLGIYCSVYRRGAMSSGILALSMLGVSIPTFLLAIGLVLVFSLWLGWLPSFGRGETRGLFGIQWGLLTLDGWRHALMPAAVICLFQLGVLLRLVRGEMLEVSKSDFIKFCWARGLPKKTIYLRHALRNSLVPLVTTIGVQLSSLLAFSIVTERVFQWPGLGQLLLQAIEFSDVPLLSAYLILVGLVFMVSNQFVDLMYRYLDPRTRVA